MTQEYTSRPVLQNLGRHGWLQGLELVSRRTSAPVARYFGGVRYAEAPTPSQRFRRTKALPANFSYGSEAEPTDSSGGGCKVCPQPDWPGVLDPSDRAQWDEDCVQANIWIPAGPAPAAAGGWPVLFHIHGGFLQFGDANKGVDIVAKMYEETTFRAIVVMPAYRVNMFGFLASQELELEAQGDGEHAGNMGFWDQRTALEWTAKMIPWFGGNPANIAVSGYSAGRGAHSVFHQLSHDLYLPANKSLIKRAIMWSNGCGVQPKSVEGHQQAFDELVSLLGIPASATASVKLAELRKARPQKLVDCISKLKRSQFRATSDGDFVSKNLIDEINSGNFGRRMKDRGVKLFIGDCRDEHNLYRAWRTPADSGDAVHARLAEDYPEPVVAAIMDHYAPAKQLPGEYADWTTLFGHIYADLQVHCLERGLINRLVAAAATGGLQPDKDVFRYRIDLRLGCADAFLPAAWGATHATDDTIWWWGNGWSSGLSAEEKQTVAPLHDLFAQFVAGDCNELNTGCCRWPTTSSSSSPQTVLRRTETGTLEPWHDDSEWDRALRVWELVNGTRQSHVAN